MKQCPKCGMANVSNASICDNCGEDLSRVPSTGDFPTSGVIFLGVAVVCIVAAFSMVNGTILPAVLIGLACFLAIGARMVQAAAQHREVMEELRRPRSGGDQA